MNLLNELEPFDLDSNGSHKKTLRVLIEIPKGSNHKYEYNPLGYLTIVRDLDPKYRYPVNYGSVPMTLAGDNDPIDALVFSDEPICAGTIVNCEVVGVIKTVDNGEQDDKILAVPYYDHSPSVDLYKIVKFLKEYKFPYQSGTEIKEVLGRKEAIALIEEAAENFKKEH